MQQLFTPKTLAAFLGLSEQTIYNRHSQGGNLPPAIKLGRSLRFHPSEVETWLTQQHKAPHNPAPLPQERRRSGRPTKAEEIARRKLH